MSKMDDWKANKFEGLTHAELRTAGALIGCNFGPNATDKNMRIKLCEKLGELPNIKDTADDEPATPAAPAAPVKLRRMTRPRLAPGDVWEGRRHRVVVAKGPEAQSHKAFVLYWNFVAKSFPYDKEIDMPWPYYNILKTARIGTVVQKKIRDDGGMWIATENEDVFTPRFSFRDMNVTPGDEGKPGSILEYWQMEAKNNDFFRNLIKNPQGGRNKLIQIRSDLYGSVGPTYYKDLTDEDIWQSVIQFLGFEDIFYEDFEAA